MLRLRGLESETAMTKSPLKERYNTVALLILFVITILISRLCYLQIFQGPGFTVMADNNRIRLLPITAPRGAFYDRNGALLVTSRPGFSVSLVPINGPIAPVVLDRLGVILGMKPEAIKAKIAQQDNPFEPIRISHDAGPEIITRIHEQRDELPGVIIEVQAVRNYLDNGLAAHLFGYVGEISDADLAKKKSAGYKSGDLIGKSGLERVYDKELRGSDGGSQIEVNVSGKPVKMLQKKEPVLGNSLVLTIDKTIQKAAEKAMDDRLLYLQDRLGNPNAKAAAAVVMNPQTGEILAIVSRPTYNPNLFNGGISAKDWKAINDNPFNPMQNRSIGAEYSPGSAFKIVTGAAALELNKITPEEKILDTGRHWIIPKGNAHGAALGWINFHTALAKSDNVYFYELGNRLGIDNLEKFARAFGLGAPTGINLIGEDSGLVANRKYKEEVYEEEWYLSETFDAAIGQGFQLVTPIQMASLISQIANGGKRYRPYVVSQIVSPDGVTVKEFQPEVIGSIDLSAKTLTAIREALRDVSTSAGTAGYIFDGFSVPIASKTSTVENPHGDDHGWFVAYGPYDNPTIAIAVIVEQGGYGSDSAAPIARKIMEAAFHLPPSKDAADLYAEERAAKATPPAKVLK